MTDTRPYRRKPDTEVTCIACGESVPRSDAREYDKYGDRWGRDGKDFEYLCKPCHSDCCHQPRKGLEETLVHVENDHATTQAFIAEYYSHVSDGLSTES
jgi:hypothetical protein